MVSTSIEQLRQPTVPHSWQPVRRAGASSVIPHSHVAFIASPPPSPPSSVSGATASRGLTLGPRAKQSNVIVFIGTIKYIDHQNLWKSRRSRRDRKSTRLNSSHQIISYA